MTKEEFLKMVDVALEQLDKEKSKWLSRIEYYKKVNPNGQEFADASYQFMLVSRKVEAFRYLIGLPAYTRIQAMSDEEIAEYKKDEINNLRLEGVGIAAEIEKLKKEIEALKAQHEELLNHFIELKNSERDSAINKGKQLQLDIQAKELELKELELKLNKLKTEQEEISKKTSDEIKSQLTKKHSINLSSALGSIQSEPSSSIELLATVGRNSEKAMQMARLLSNLAYTEKHQSDISTYLNIGWEIPSKLRNEIEKDYTYNHGDIKGTQRFFEIYESFIKQFDEEVEKFNSQFTMEKLRGLPGKEYRFESTTVDFDFLKLHSDKLSPGELETLQANVLKKDKLSKKLIKTKDVKREIEDLNWKIKRAQSDIYQKIIGWYKAYDASIIGIGSYFFHNDSERLLDDLNSWADTIAKTKKALEEFKKRLESAQSSLDNQIKQHNEKVNGIKQEIRAIGGTGFETADIPWAREQTQDNLESIASATVNIDRRQFVSQVQQEAQNQANLKEAELKGITVEELLQMKNQTSNASDITLSSQSEDELSHGIKK